MTILDKSLRSLIKSSYSLQKNQTFILYHIAPVLKSDKVKKNINKMLVMKHLAPSQTEWAPLFSVPKKDGTLQFLNVIKQL